METSASHELISYEEMKEALLRLGYLLEGRAATLLNNEGYSSDKSRIS